MAAGAFPPCRTNFPDFLKAAHTLALAQGEAFRSIKAASSKATVGSAYEMAPAYPKTDSEADRAAAARYHAMNNVFFLEAAMKGHYPKAFVGEPPYEIMGFKEGDEKIITRRLTGWAFTSTPAVSLLTRATPAALAGDSAEPRLNRTAASARDPYTGIPGRDADRRATNGLWHGGMATWDLRPGYADLPGIQPSGHRDHRERLRLSRRTLRQ